MTREWQDVEYKLLREFVLAGKADAQIGDILARGAMDVQTTRRRLGIKSKHDRPSRLWSDDEVKKLRQLIELKRSDAQIASELNRSLDSVACKRAAMNLQKAPPYVPALNARVIFKSVDAALNYRPMQPCEKDRFERDAQLRAFAIAMRNAGHRSGTGELKIVPDGRPTVFLSRTMSHSACGSSAAMCAEGAVA